MAELKAVFQNKDLMVFDKPWGIICFPEGQSNNDYSLMEEIVKTYPDMALVGQKPRFGAIHRLDKDTSGLFMAARSNQALEYFQKALKAREIEKKYLTLLVGKVKENTGIIDALIGRCPSDRTKQACFLPLGPDARKKGVRPAITQWVKIKEFKDFTLVEAWPKTGRKHQIRAHFSFIGHPIAGDKVYGFKNQPSPKGLERQFLHAYYLKIKMPDGKTEEIKINLPKDLQNAVDILE